MQQSVTTPSKPILIDALHINMGGALMILNHLIDRLIALAVNFVLLKDERCPVLRSESRVLETIVMSSKERPRLRYYKSHRESFSAVLCLGNIPPAIKMPVPVYTYIHNVSLLKIPQKIPIQRRLSNALKRFYIRFLANNTDMWFVQTENTANLVNKHINQKKLPVSILPFFYIPNDIIKTPVHQRKDYVFIGEFTGAKGHEYLIDAWGILAERNIYPNLHLTISDSRLLKKIDKVKSLGAKIINHGYVSFDKVVEIYNLSKATVYPSLNESLGLGIIEAISAGCDVIGCDLPYVYSVCSPSEVFQPETPESIVDAVCRYEMGDSAKTSLLINDRADDLIKQLLVQTPK